MHAIKSDSYNHPMDASRKLWQGGARKMRSELRMHFSSTWLALYRKKSKREQEFPKMTLSKEK